MSTADAYPFPTQPAPLRFAVALAAVGVVFLLDRFFGTLIDDGSHFLLLGTAVMASAWFAGTGPALAATVLGAVPKVFAFTYAGASVGGRPGWVDAVILGGTFGVLVAAPWLVRWWRARGAAPPAGPA